MYQEVLTPTARAGSGLPKCSKMKFSVTEPPPNSKIPLTTPPEIQSRIFWCNKKISENFFCVRISPEVNRKQKFWGTEMIILDPKLFICHIGLITEGSEN